MFYRFSEGPLIKPFLHHLLPPCPFPHSCPAVEIFYILFTSLKQSDDKTLKIWRISDWKLEATVSDPFEECGGTTHVLRLNWSPDGQYVVSSHAMNNGGPVAKIIERDGWRARMDFVGHRRAITSVVRAFLFDIVAGNKPWCQFSCYKYKYLRSRTPITGQLF